MVNNVGIPLPRGKMYHFLDIDNLATFINNIFNINLTAFNHMMEIIIPIMTKNKNGIVINLSSIAGLIPFPKLTMYSGSKFAIDYTSIGLYNEYANMGICIKSLVPGFVYTDLSKDYKFPPWFMPNAKTYTKHAINDLQVHNRTAGYNIHIITMFLIEIFTMIKLIMGFDVIVFVYNYVSYYVNKYFL